jgi:16S rRNA (cytosine967-C5)-methyltransferase
MQTETRAPRRRGGRVTDADPLAARRVALSLLDAVLCAGQTLDEALAGRRPLRHLDERDRAFARALVATTLRRLGQIDAILAAVLAQPAGRLAPKALNLLRLGACQLAFLGTPAHAVVHTAVALAGRTGRACAPGLVNAVLRRIAREGEAIAAAQDAARLNTPAWLWAALAQAYGEPVCREIALAHLQPAALDLTAIDPAETAILLGGRLLPTGTVRLARAVEVTTLSGYAQGRWWVQDAASALPARLLGDVRGRRVIDLCAAPGGKTAQLAAAGAQVLAVDRSPQRMARMQENLARLRLDAEAVVADATVWRPPQPADAVLVDAPCSATGTIRRHPDIAWRKQPQEVAALTVAQDRLLRAAVQMVRPGGLIVFSVCSLLREEGPARVTALQGDGVGVRRLPIRPEDVGGAGEIVSSEGDLRSLPCHWAALGGLDGFYACRLVRT